MIVVKGSGMVEAFKAMGSHMEGREEGQKLFKHNR